MVKHPPAPIKKGVRKMFFYNKHDRNIYDAEQVQTQEFMFEPEELEDLREVYKDDAGIWRFADNDKKVRG